MRPIAYLFFTLILFTRPALAADISSFRGLPAGEGGIFARGTVTLNDRGIVCEVRRVFRETTIGWKYTDIKSFSTDIGLFRGRVNLSMTDGAIVTLTAPPGAARDMKRMLSDRILSP
ncbi:MAG: hypothetical protein Q8P18_21310 [Pseudomonadota bacterium]|nr:hypothetical protein [Pseudomonadota bacterium]